MTNLRKMLKRIATMTVIAGLTAIAAGCGDNGNETPDATDTVETDAADVTGDTSDVPVVNTGYSAGIGITDLSGEVGSTMGGYGNCMNVPDYCRFAEGVHDPLLARAIAVRDNATGEAVIFVATDLVGVLRYDVDLIHEAAAEKFLQEFGIDNFDGRRIIITASHTHHSTDTMGLWGPLDGSGRNEEYAAFMREQVLDAAVKAWADLRPVDIFHANTATAPNYDKDIYADDTAIQTLHFVDKATGNTAFTMTRWTAHVTNYPQALKAFSAGHVGTFCRRMEEMTGAPAVYVQGMVGSVYTEGYMLDKPGEEPCVMDDMFPEGYQDPDLRQEFISAVGCLGSGLAELAFADLANETPVPETGLKHRFHKFGFHPETKVPVMLDYTMFDYVEIGPLHFDVPSAEEIDNPDSTMDTQFNWTTIGDVHLITVPGEGMPEFGKQIERVLARSGGKVLTVGLGQDWLGYILSWQQWRDDDDRILYNKSLSGGQYLQSRYLEELQQMVTTETGKAPECNGAEVKCSEDGYKVMECHSGLWFETNNCVATMGGLCEVSTDGLSAQCVEPWKWGSPTWDKCEENPAATTESLGIKATYYDEIAGRLHINPQLKWLAGVTLPKGEVACTGDQVAPCYAPTVSEAEATWEDVATWHTGENDGLWSALYLASQAYRYAATKDSEALEIIRTLMEGEKWRMEITGVPGLFTRQYIPAGVDGIACPTDLESYIPDVEKDDNRWLKIASDGCIQTVDGNTMEWVKHDVCVPVKYADWCLLDNVSQDEYAGHMFALGAVWRLVDDKQIKTSAANMLGQIGNHLMVNWMRFKDWDGRDTEHGKMNVYSFANAPGFLAVHSLDFMLMAATASGRKDLRDFYDKCLLQSEGKICEGWPWDGEPAYDSELDNLVLYVGSEGCKANYNNFSMVFAAIHHLAWFADDIALKEKVQAAWANHFMNEGDQPRAIEKQKNPWFNFGYAAMKRLDADNPHAYDLVSDGICSLREFRTSQAAHFGDSASAYPGYCESRFDGQFQAEFPVPVGERCASTFEWWGDPYSRETCGEAPWNVDVPTGYLLPYWMGRYYGFITADM